MQLTPPKKRPLTPIHRQQNPRPQTHTLRKIHAPPKINRQQPPFPTQPTHVIKNRRIPDIRQAPQMLVLKRLVTRRINVPVPHRNLVNLKPWLRLRHLGKLLREIFALLRRALRRGWQGGELAVDLLQELAELAEVERAGLVGVVLLEEGVEAAHVVARLREPVFDLLGDFAPVLEGDLQGFGVAAVCGGDALEEGDDVVGYVVCDRRAVAYGVDGGLWSAEEAQMGICGQGVLVCLSGAELVGEAGGEGGLGCCKVNKSNQPGFCLVFAVIHSSESSKHRDNVGEGRYIQTPVDHRQKPIGSSLVTVSPFASFCVKRILSSLTSLTRAFVMTST